MVKKKFSPIIIFLHFFKLGCTSFGGAAMVFNIRRLAVEQMKLLDGAAFEKGIAFCQIIPGATAMQTAAYCGLKARGQAGAFAAYLGFGLPAFIIMCTLSWAYGHVAFPMDFFDGVRIAVIAIIFHAAFSLGKNSVSKVEDIALIVVGLDLFIFKVHPLFSLVIAAAYGLVFSFQKADQVSAALAGEEGISVRWKSLGILSLLAFTGLLVLLHFNPRAFDLAFAMVRVSVLSFGGGFATIPLLYQEIEEHLGLMPLYDFANGIALGQMTPGPLSIIAAFVGYVTQGLSGAVIATIYIFLPSYLMVIGFAGPYARLSRNRKVSRILNAVYLSFVGLIAGSGVGLIAQNPLDWKQAILCAGLFGALYLKVPPFVAVLMGIGAWKMVMLLHGI